MCPDPCCAVPCCAVCILPLQDAQGSSSGSLTEHSSLPDLFLDGPFGAPTQAWGDYGVVTLIGAGIGVTPMASVLRWVKLSLLYIRLYNC
jgi:NAD(P)H-flavin reductase